jgi:hypothetical protein
VEEVRRRLDRTVADGKAESVRVCAGELGEERLVDEQEDAVVAARVQEPAPVGLVAVVEHDVVRGRDDRFARTLDHDARSREDDEVPLLGPVLPRPARIARPAVELAEDDPVALEDQLLDGVETSAPARARKL